VGKMSKKKSPGKKRLKERNDQETRPPVVVVLGHIDHGKTALLDRIRQTRIAAKEAGGITQRIGAYQVEVKESGSGGGEEQARPRAIRKITFIDTPGHAAFAKMRARGARVADIAVLVVAADDGVMSQTKEAIAHARAAKIPIIVAINKVDLKNINLERVKGQLVKEGIVPEDQGGDVPVVAVSAKTGQGVSELLEMIGLVGDLLELRAKPDAPLSGVVIESSLSPQQGPLATLIIMEGTLRVGEEICVGRTIGKVRALIGDCGQRLKEALPGMPVVVLGLPDVVPVGVTVTEGSARGLSRLRRAGSLGAGRRRSFDGPTARQSVSSETNLNVVLRADTQGSLEAVSAALAGLVVGGKRPTVLMAGVGQVTDSDIYLAQSAGGVVLGFNVGGSASVRKLADDLGVGLRFFTIIYELLEAVEKLLKGVSALEKAEIKGEGAVIQTFTLHSGDVVLGVRVVAGKIKYRDKVKVLRGEGEECEEIGRGQVRGLKIGEKEVSKAEEGDETGVLIKPQVAARKGDRIVVV